MDKNKHIKGKVSTQEQNEKGLVGIDNIAGFAVQVTTVTIDEGNSWECNATAIFSATRDKETWVERSFPVKTFDTNPENALATVMLAISNKIDDPEFFEEFETALDEIDRQREEAVEQE